MASHVVLSSGDEHAWSAVARRVLGWHQAVTQQRVTPTLSDAEIRSGIDVGEFAEPRDLATLVESVSDLLEHGTLHATHPRYFGLFVPGVRAPGVIGDTLAALYNLQLGAWWHAPAASHLEHLALEFSRDDSA